jgi:hypothetical protein
VGADEDGPRLRRARSGEAVDARREGEARRGGGERGRGRRRSLAGKAKHGAATDSEVRGGGPRTEGRRRMARRRSAMAWLGAAAELDGDFSVWLRERE